MFTCWKRVTSFETGGVREINYNPSMRQKHYPENRSAAFSAICVDRIGDSLRSLTMDNKFFPFGWWNANVRSIGEGCQNVETINFILDGCRTLDIHFDSFIRLKTFTVSPARIAGGHISARASASASVLLSFSTSIEVIRGLGGIYFENAAQMEGFFADRPSLKEICLGALFTRDRSKADMFRVIAQRCPHLKSIKLSCSNCIDYSGVVALESMKDFHIEYGVLDEMEIVAICERSPLVEALDFRLRFFSNLHLQSAALNALGTLTKLAELCLHIFSDEVVAPSLVTEFVLELARNLGASLRHLELPREMPLPTAAIEALANGCGKLRDVEFCVRVGEVEPASIRLLIDFIVDNPDWLPLRSEPPLKIRIGLLSGTGYVSRTDRAPFQALAAPAAHLPAGVKLSTW